MNAITHVVWSAPESERAGHPLLIALHGRGADESSLLGLASHLPPATVLAALRGPLSVEGGFTWFENRGIGRPITESIAATATGLRAWLDPLREDFTSLWLLGFSGGAAMAAGLLLDDPDAFDATVLLSGTLPWDSGRDTTPGRLSGRRVFFGIDPQDPVIPGDLVTRSEDWLTRESGADLDLRHYPGMGHTITAGELADVCSFLAASLAQS